MFSTHHLCSFGYQRVILILVLIIPIFTVDRSLYVSCTVLLDKCILAQNRHFFYILLHILNTKHEYAYQVFGVVARDIVVSYANINTKCFFCTSNIYIFIIILSILCA